MVQSYTLADDRITIFEESFATGFGDFIVETDESPDASKGHWEHSNEGFVYISGLNSKDWTNGVSKLMSPVIDLGLYHDAILTFEYNVSQSTYNRMFTKVLIKEEDGEGCLEIDGNMRNKRFRYVGKDNDPLADMRNAKVINNLHQYWKFCQDSAGFSQNPGRSISSKIARTCWTCKLNDKKENK